MGLFGRKPVHVELEVSSDTFDVVYLCVCGLVAAKALAAFFRRGRLAATLRARVASLVEAGAYAFAYAAIALCFGGCVDGLFGAYDALTALGQTGDFDELGADLEQFGSGDDHPFFM